MRVDAHKLNGISMTKFFSVGNTQFVWYTSLETTLAAANDSEIG